MTATLQEIILHLPKVDLHRHLEGAVRLSTLVDIAREYEFEMPEYDAELLRPFVQMMPNETHNAQHFLAKFQTIRQFFRSAEVIRRITREAIEDAAADQVVYLELRFTPRALSNILQCSYEEVIAWVCDAAQQAAASCGILVRLIVSMNRHESVAIGAAVVDAALDFRDRGVVAVDLAGNEQDFPAAPFEPIFTRAKAGGLSVTIHAGEWAGPENITEAIERLGADRIGHGVRLAEDMRLLEHLMHRQITLEVCPTSNIHSGVVRDWHQHPLPQLWSAGVHTTINTDDPLVSNITLSDEMRIAVEGMGLGLDALLTMTRSAVNAAFLTAAEKEILAARLMPAQQA
jgi:adenosine deaminase